MSIKIVIADDHQLTREGIRTMLEREPDMEVLGEAEDGRAAARMARDLGPDVILMDVCMPEMNGIVATGIIHSESPKIKVLALSMLDDRRFVYHMLRAGASGYIIKDCSLKELIQAIRRVMQNRTYLSPGIMDIVVQDYVMPPAYSTSPDSFNLTLREKEVLQLVAEGHSTAQIANSLHVSVKTIESHRQRLMEKLNTRGIAGLTKYAIREGLTSV
ncbi:MAG: DNA-binding response regulator [Desulfobacca sp. RBG_16_58_9]|nr:MAG: DNA-binding response regulator [Desulfobacca sp. RBG_16_58_9]